MSDGKPALPKPEIEKCFAAPRVMTETAPPFIFTSSDPSGGGPSHMSICSAYFSRNGELVIIGLDSEPVRDDREEYLLLTRHYQRLLQFRHYRESRLVFVPEANLGLESSHLDTMVKDVFPSVTTYYEKPNRPGVTKTGAITRGYQFELSNSLCYGSIRFEHDVFTTTREKTPACMLNLLQEQMLRYRWERKPAVDLMGKDRFTLTGKMGSKSDDLLIAVMMSLYWGRLVMRDPSGLGV